MKVLISLTDESGKVFEGEAELLPIRGVRAAGARPKKEAKRQRVARASKLDFTKPERAFFKSYAKGLTGREKFVLLVAYLAKGQVGEEVPLGDVEKHWNRMTSHLDGEFNRKYSSTAKDGGWVDTRKKGIYVLTGSWEEVLKETNG
jgi:hypothetical protein